MSFVTSNFNVVVISNSTMHKNNGDLRSYVTPCKIGYFILSPAFFDEVPSKMKAICKMTKQNKQSPGFLLQFQQQSLKSYWLQQTLKL